MKHEKTVKSFTLRIFLLSVLAGGTPANAAEAGRTLVNAFGISAPSSTTLILGENPAGFSQIAGVKLQLLGGTNNDSNKTKYYDAGIYAGNNVFGVGIAGQKYTSDAGDQADADLYWGLGGGFDTIAIGVNGKTTGGTNSTTSTQFGVLFGSRSPLTIGAVFQNDNLSLYDFGAGVCYDISPGVNLALDTYHYRVSGELSYAVGARFAAASAEISLGYKVMDKNATNEDHIMAGLALNFSSTWGFQYMYNQLLKHMLGLTVRF